ncbi:hypothetical protein B0H19DRAFT_1289388, partial [Mycena capillaripes]
CLQRRSELSILFLLEYILLVSLYIISLYSQPICFIMLVPTRPLAIAALIHVALAIPRGRAASGFSTALSSNTTTTKQASSGPNLPSFKLSGVRLSSNVTARNHVSRQEEEFNCEIPAASANWRSSYTSEFLLSVLQWTGVGEAECTIPMSSITYSSSVTNGPSSGTVAKGECVGCAALTATNTAYSCQQAPVEGEGDGPWDATFTIKFIAPPDFEFTTPGTNCVIAGPVATCEDTASAGEVLRFDFPAVPGNLPSGEEPLLDSLAIKGIRSTHFPPVSDPTKSLFNAGLTDGDLGEIFITGWADPTVQWIQQTGENQVMWRKEFNFPGVGRLAISAGGEVAQQVTMATDGFGTLNSMFPGPK